MVFYEIYEDAQILKKEIDNWIIEIGKLKGINELNINKYRDLVFIQREKSAYTYYILKVLDFLKSIPEIQDYTVELKVKVENLVEKDYYFKNELEFLLVTLNKFNTAKRNLLNAPTTNGNYVTEVVMNFYEESMGLINALDNLKEKLDMIVDINSKLIGNIENEQADNFVYLKIKYDVEDVDLEFMSKNMTHIKAVIDLFKSKTVDSDEFIDIVKVESGSLFELIQGSPELINHVRDLSTMVLQNGGLINVAGTSISIGGVGTAIYKGYTKYLVIKEKKAEIKGKELGNEGIELDNEGKKLDNESKKIANDKAKLELQELEKDLQETKIANIDFERLDFIVKNYNFANDEVHILFNNLESALLGKDKGVKIDDKYFKKDEIALISDQKDDK